MTDTKSPTATDPDMSRRDRILVSAERLFATGGYHQTSMREIAAEAGVGLPLIVYHFESKERLYTEVFDRRHHVNDARLKVLAAVGDLHAADAVERIVDAFVDPVLDLHEHPEDMYYARLVLREITDPSSGERSQIKGMFEPVARSFVEALHEALPDKPAGFHEWAYLFSVGALNMSAFDDRVGGADDDLVAARHASSKRTHLKRYIAAALRHG